MDRPAARLLGACWLMLAGLLSSCSDAPRPPNVVVFVIDTLRADAVGAYGAEGDPTPAFDALASQAVLFTNAYAPAPWTLPSTVSLLTSTFPCEHGVVVDGDRIDARIGTLAERLAEAGYESANLYANPYAGKVSGLDRGFDSHALVPFTYGGTIAGWLASRVDAGAPFFLYIHNVEPHDPYAAEAAVDPRVRERVNQISARFHALTRVDWKEGRPPGTTDNSPAQRRVMDRLERLEAAVRRLYAADVRLADDRLGSVIETLRARGVWDDTLLVVTSDHGEAFGEHGGWQHDQSVYEELIRVPLLLRLPEGRRGGTRVDAPVSLLDVLPTILDAVGRPDLGGGARGRSLLDRGAESPDPAGEPEPLQVAVRANRKKYYRPFDELRGDLNVAFRAGRWKGIWNAEPRRFELYDLVADPLEQRDRSERHPERVARWREIAEGALAGCAAERADTPAVPLDEESRERLRALGYVD